MSATSAEQSKQGQMALTTHRDHGQQLAPRTLKTKWDVTRKQALKHIGQLVTLCYCCCKAASTRLQHMLLSLARMCPLFLQGCVLNVYRESVRAGIMHHVEMRSHMVHSHTYNTCNHTLEVYNRISTISVTQPAHFKLGGVLLGCGLPSHNVASLHKQLYSQRREKQIQCLCCRVNHKWKEIFNSVSDHRRNWTIYYLEQLHNTVSVPCMFAFVKFDLHLGTVSVVHYAFGMGYLPLYWSSALSGNCWFWKAKERLCITETGNEVWWMKLKKRGKKYSSLLVDRVGRAQDPP